MEDATAHSILIFICFLSIDLNAGTENVAPSIIDSLTEREQGGNSGTVAYRPMDVGTRGKRWTTILNGA